MKTKILFTTFFLMLAVGLNAQWTSSGNKLTTQDSVGIGTTTPAYIFDVVGTGHFEKLIVGGVDDLIMTLKRNGNGKILMFERDNGTRFGYFGLDSSAGTTFFLASYDDLGFRVNNTTEALYIASDGKVGIGDISPTHELSVSGNSIISGTRFPLEIKNGNTGTQGENVGIKFADLNGSSLLYYNGLGDKFTFNSDLGITGAFSASDSVTLANLAGTGDRLVQTDANGLLSATLSTTDIQSSIDERGSLIAGDGLSWNGTTGKIDVDSQSIWNGNGADAYWSSGKIGIGINDPDEKLHVNGAIKSDGRLVVKAPDEVAAIISRSGNGMHTLFQRSSTNMGYIGTNSTTGTSFYLASYQGLGFRTNNSADDAMYIRSDGNVGIGDSDPSQKLSVGGDFSTTGSATFDVLAGTGDRLVQADANGLLSATLSTTDIQSSIDERGSLIAGDGLSWNGTTGKLDLSGGAIDPIYTPSNSADHSLLTYSDFSYGLSYHNVGAGSNYPTGTGQVWTFKLSNSRTHRLYFGKNTSSLWIDGWDKGSSSWAGWAEIFTSKNYSQLLSNVDGDFEVAGKLGVGVVDPTYKLDVAGTVNATEYLLNGQPMQSGLWTDGGTGASYLDNIGIGRTVTSDKLSVLGSTLLEGTTTVGADLKVGRGLVDNAEIKLQPGIATGNTLMWFKDYQGGNDYHLGRLEDTGALQVHNYLNGSVQQTWNTDGSVDFTSDVNLGGNLNVTETVNIDSNLEFDGGNQGYRIFSIDETDGTPWTSGVSYGGLAIGSSVGTNQQMFTFTDGASNNVIFNISSSENSGTDWYSRLAVSQAGKVGIGTDSPSHQLDVTGTINATEYLLNGQPMMNGLWSENTGDAYFSSGNVGIGRDNPSAKLHLQEGNQQMRFLTGTNTSGYTFDIGVNDDGINFHNNATIRGYNFSNINGDLFSIASDGAVVVESTASGSPLTINKDDANANYPSVTSRGDLVQYYNVENNSLEFGLAGAVNTSKSLDFITT